MSEGKGHGGVIGYKEGEILGVAPEIYLYLLTFNQAKRHVFLVKIVIVQFQRVPFQPIRLKAYRNKEFTGLFAGEHNSQVDLFEPRQCLRISNCSLQQSFTYPLPTQLLRHIHPPDNALVAFFYLFLSLEASNANQCLPLESTECRVIWSSFTLTQPTFDPINTSFKNLLIRCAKRLRIIAQGSQSNVSN